MTMENQYKSGREMKVSIPEELPILKAGDNIIFPSIIIPLAAVDQKLVHLIDAAMEGSKIIGIFAQQADVEHPTLKDFHSVGTAAIIARMLKVPDGSIRIFLQGLSRIRMKEITQTEPYVKAKVEVIEERIEKTTELEALSRNLLNMFQKVVELAPNLPAELSVAAVNLTEPGDLADFIAAYVNLKHEEGQDILETLDITDRVKKLTGYINRELEILELGSKIQTQIKDEADKSQRDFFLREQLKAIQKELGEVDDHTLEINELREQLKKTMLPPEAHKEAERELDRLSKMSPAAAEYTVARTYLDWLINLPWAKSTKDNLDIARAAKILDEDHYNLKKVKERILDYLAVRKLKEDMKGPILCFVGPPGTGKTSVCNSIARALGRKFSRISLGGVRDEAEIRGHRRTYVGALPGRIIQGIRRAESNNPVFVLDEIDKLGADFRGDPSAALLELLDPEQNNAFIDHYLDVPFDLSKVIFITTANIIDPIPPALQDRLEIIELPGYTEQEKLHIARQYLIPRQIKENGLGKRRVQLSDEIILEIIRNYTWEAGVRNLEREIGTVCRKLARQVAEGSKRIAKVTPDKLHDYLGHQKFHFDLAEKTDEVGVVTGLAWTQAGGDVLFIEVTPVSGKGSLILTGKLGEVMQESARAALTYTRSKATLLGIEENFYNDKDIHIHIPAGAIPKDGPSAGITMTIALISALTNRPARKEVAMTGEITLRGKVLPIGGVKEKVLAAHRAGIKTVIMPKENEKDLEEIPQEIKDELKFVFVDHIDQAIDIALRPKIKTPPSTKASKKKSGSVQV